MEFMQRSLKERVSCTNATTQASTYYRRLNATTQASTYYRRLNKNNLNENGPSFDMKGWTWEIGV